MPRGATIVGKVTAGGQPVTGGDIGLYDAGTGAGVKAAGIASDGSFRFETQKAGAYKIEYRPTGNALKGWHGGNRSRPPRPSRSEPEPISMFGTDHARGGWPHPRRVTAGGRPVAGTIGVYKNDAPLMQVAPAATGVTWSRHSSRRATSSSFRPAYDDPALGRWTGGAAAQADALSIDVTVGQDSTRDQELPVGGTITGVVRDAQRSPLPGRTVWAGIGTTGPRKGGFTDASGAYTIVGLEPGRYWIEFGPQPGFE